MHRKRSLNFRSFQRKINPEAKFAIIPETTFLATSISLYYPGISNVTGNLHSKKFWVSEAYLMKRILKNSQPLRNFPTQDSILGRSDPKKICKTIHYPQYFTTHSTISVISAQNTILPVFSVQQLSKLSHGIGQKERISQSNLA